MRLLNFELKQRKDNLDDHISTWDFKKLEKIALAIGFSYVIESKYQASVSKEMQTIYFDKNSSVMSLYVDFVK